MTDPIPAQLLIALAARYGGDPDGGHPLGGRASPARGPELLPTRSGAVVARVGPVVVKVHRIGTSREDLARRLAVAADPRLREVLLAPLSPEPIPVPLPEAPGGGGGREPRWASVWPAGDAVPRDPRQAPWTRAAQLLAALHLAPVADLALPPVAAAAGVRRAVAALGERTADPDGRAGAVRAAWRSLPAELRRQPTGTGVATAPVVHGDWHLGQLLDAGAGWRLIDLDDLGRGDPRWDLARPAAYEAVGVLEPGTVVRFLDVYRAAGGPADPGPAPRLPLLDPFARALVVRAAATGLLQARAAALAPDPVTLALIAACARIAAAAPSGAPPVDEGN